MRALVLVFGVGAAIVVIMWMLLAIANWWAERRLTTAEARRAEVIASIEEAQATLAQLKAEHRELTDQVVRTLEKLLEADDGSMPFMPADVRDNVNEIIADWRGTQEGNEEP